MKFFLKELAPFKKSSDKLSVLQSRDIILSTKVLIVKPMVSPVVMYGYESWTIKKVENKRMMFSNYNAGEDS